MLRDPEKEHLRRRSAATSRRPSGRTLLGCAARELDQRAGRCIAFGEPVERLIALVQREAAGSSSSPRPGIVDLDGRWPTGSGVGTHGAARPPDGYVAWIDAYHPGPHSALARALSQIPSSSA